MRKKRPIRAVRQGARLIRRWGLILLLAAPLAAAFAAYGILDVEIWRADLLLARRDGLREAVSAAPLASVLIFALAYFLIISSALPVSPPMSLIAGFLFGRWLGTAVILIAATAGALVVFNIARASSRTALGERLRARAGPIYGRIARDLRANAFGYLVVMRLVPFFPFFMVNIVAGLFGLPARTFVLATLIGRAPAAFLYVSLGQEVGRISSFDELATPQIFAILSGLALMALLPVALAHKRRSACLPDGEEPAEGTGERTGQGTAKGELRGP